MAISEAQKVLNIIMRAKDQMSPGIRAAQRTLTVFTRVTAGALGKIRSILAGIGRAFTSFITGPLGILTAAAGGFSVLRIFGGASEVERQLGEIGTLLGDVSDQALERLGRDIKRTAVEGGQAFQDEFKAAYDAISAGVPAQKLTTFLSTANRLAVGGATDVATSVDLLTSSINAFGASFDEADRHADALFTTVRLGKTTVAELGGSLGRVAPMAAAAGLSIEELGASVAALTAAGLSTEEANTRIAAALTAMIQLTDEQRASLKAAGVDFSVAGIRANGFAQTMADLAEITGGDIEVIAKLVSNVRAIGGLLVLGADGASKLTAAMDGMGQAAGATDRAFDRMSKTLAFQGAQLRSQFREITDEIATAFFPAIGDLFGELRGWLASNRDDVRAWARETAGSVRFAAESAMAYARFFRDLVSDPSTSRLLGVAVQEAGELALVAVRETVVAGLQIMGNVLQIAARPLIVAAGVIGRKVGESLRDGIFDWVQWQDDQDRIEGLLRKIAVVKERIAGQGLFNASDRDFDLLEEYERQLVELQAKVDAPIHDAEAEIGKAVRSAVRSIAGDFDDITIAGKVAAGNIADQYADAFARIRQEATQAKIVMQQVGLFAVPRLQVETAGPFARLSEDLDAARDRLAAFRAASAEAEGDIGELLGVTDSTGAAMGVAARQADLMGQSLVGLAEDAGQAGQAIDEAGRLIRDSQIALMKGVEQAHAQLIATFDDEVDRMEELVEAGRLSVDGFSQWLYNRKELLNRQLAQSTEQFAREEARLIQAAQIESLVGYDRRHAEVMAQHAQETQAIEQKWEDGAISFEAYSQLIELETQRHAGDLRVLQGSIIDGIVDHSTAAQKEIMTAYEVGTQFARDMGETLERGFGRLFAGIATGAEDMQDRLKLVVEESLQLLGQLAARIVTTFLLTGSTRAFPVGGFTVGGGLGGFAQGGVVQGGGSIPVMAFAGGGVTPGAGGVVDRATLFFAGEGRHREAIVPLPDGRAIPAVITEPAGGGGQRPVTVNITQNISAIDSRGVQEVLQREAGTIKRIVQRAISQESDMRTLVSTVASGRPG